MKIIKKIVKDKNFYLLIVYIFLVFLCLLNYYFEDYALSLVRFFTLGFGISLLFTFWFELIDLILKNNKKVKNFEKIELENKRKLEDMFKLLKELTKKDNEI